MGVLFAHPIGLIDPEQGVPSMNWFSLMMLVMLVVVNFIAGCAIASKWINPMLRIQRILATGTFNVIFMLYAALAISEPEEFGLNKSHHGFEGFMYDIYGWSCLLASSMLVICYFSYLLRVPQSKQAGRSMAGW